MLSFTSRRPLGAAEPFLPDSYLLVTTGTFQKRSFIAADRRKEMLLESLDFNCYKWKWSLLAFALLDNHYHLVLQTPPGDPSRLAHIVQSANSFCAYYWRKDDPGLRTRIWWNSWETRLPDADTLRKYINYVHENPRFHGKTTNPAEYPFSSYAGYLAADAATIRRWEADHPASALEVIDSF